MRFTICAQENVNFKEKKIENKNIRQYLPKNYGNSNFVTFRFSDFFPRKFLMRSSPNPCSDRQNIPYPSILPKIRSGYFGEIEIKI